MYDYAWYPGMLGVRAGLMRLCMHRKSESFSILRPPSVLSTCLSTQSAIRHGTEKGVEED